MNRLLPLLLLVATLALPAAASADPALDGEFPVDAKPEELVQGPDGNVWFLMGQEFGRITPDGTVSDDFAMPGGHSGTDIVASASRLWIARSGGVVEVDPASPATPVDHPVTEIGTAQGIALEADGDLWVVEDGGLVEVGTDGLLKREIAGKSIDGGTPSGRGIALGSDGRLWWGDFLQKAVQVTNPLDGSVDAVPAGEGVQEVAAGPEGQIAYTAPQSIIGRIATDTKAKQETPNPGGDATGIVLGNDQAYWSAEFLPGTLARLAPDGTLTHPIAFTDKAGPRHIATGPDDTLWVSLEGDAGDGTGMRIARITGVKAPAADPQPQPQPDPEQPVCCAPPPPPPPPDTLAPAFSAVSARPSQVRRGQSVFFRFTLTEAATLTLRFDRVQKGRRRGGRCVAPTRRLRRAPRCTRFTRVATQTRQVAAGTTSIGFAGRLRGRLIRPGSYALTLTARDAAGNLSLPRTVRFRILPRRGR